MAGHACWSLFGAVLNDLWDSAVLFREPVGWIREIVDLFGCERLAAARYLDWSGTLRFGWMYLVRNLECPGGRMNSRPYLLTDYRERKNRTQNEHPDVYRLPHTIPPEFFARLNRRKM